jgi:4-hydroxybenzoate polyprenyltransferase/phosphoserine phosphatase
MESNDKSLCSSECESRVLCVDLDGTLLATDLLWESVLLLVKGKPHLLVLLPVWLFRGKAYFKRQIARRVRIDAANLPYREDVLAFLRQEKAVGRKIILASGTDRELLAPIAQHLNIFDDYIGSDGTINLTGTRKQKVLESRFGRFQFDYVGNAAADLPSWRSSNAAWLVGPSRRTLAKAKRVSDIRHIFSIDTNRPLAILRALRYHQWTKNLLLFAPLVLSHQIFNLQLFLQTLCAFIAFSFCASSIYIFNDFLDITVDRRHPRKKLRPFASGELSIPFGGMLSLMMLTSSILIAVFTLPLLFLTGLGLYFTITMAYSFWLKRVVVADVIFLSMLYTLRILIGGAAASIVISPWLLAFSLFLFSSLAFVKRYSEMNILRRTAQEVIPGRGYIGQDKEWMRGMGSSSGYLSVLVLALYINSNEVTVLYRHPQILWCACIPMLYWVNRIWFLAGRGKVDDDPINFTVKDPVSYGVGLLLGIILLAAI